MDAKNERELLKLKRSEAAKALAVRNEEKFTAYGNMPALLEYCKPIANSEFSPYDRPEDVAACLLWANDKKISPLDALSHLVMVNGRPTPDSYLIGALMQKTKEVLFSIKVIEVNGRKIREDCRPLYMYNYRDESFDQDEIDAHPELYQVVSMAQLQKKLGLKEDKLPVVRQGSPYDYRTTLVWKRFLRMPDRKVHVIEEESHYLYTDAQAAGLTDKDVWKKYLKDMLYNRAFTRGAKRIAKDLLFVSQEATEMMDVEEIPYDVVDGEIEILED